MGNFLWRRTGAFGALYLVGVLAGCGSDDDSSDDDGVKCGEGTLLVDGACVSGSAICGEGEAFDGEKCVAVGNLKCGTGTRAVAGECIPLGNVECGPGTMLVDKQCVPDGSGSNLSCGEGTEEVDDRCVATNGATCGRGTKLEDDECVPVSDAVTCGDGTELNNGECVPSDELQCGDGTIREDDECVPSAGVHCGDGTELDGNECVPQDPLSCGSGTVRDGDECVPVETNCGPGTRLEGNQCVGTVTPLAGTSNFSFTIADMDDNGVVYFLDSGGSGVHRYDTASEQFLEPFTLTLGGGTTMAVAPAGDVVYVGATGGRIDVFDTDAGSSEFFVSAPETSLWMQVVGDYLYEIDGSGAWETHAMYSRTTGMRVFADDWRNTSRGSAYAPGLKRIFTFRDSTSPNDIYYEVVDTATGALGTDTESPYHGDYSFVHPIRVTPDETKVFVATGVAFDTDDLTYIDSIGIPYVDLAFAGDEIYLLHAKGSDSEVLILDSDYDIVDSFGVLGTPLRLFIHDEVAVFTRRTTLSIWQGPL